MVVAAKVRALFGVLKFKRWTTHENLIVQSLIYFPESSVADDRPHCIGNLFTASHGSRFSPLCHAAVVTHLRCSGRGRSCHASILYDSVTIFTFIRFMVTPAQWTNRVALFRAIVRNELRDIKDIP